MNKTIISSILLLGLIPLIIIPSSATPYTTPVLTSHNSTTVPFEDELTFSCKFPDSIPYTNQDILWGIQQSDIRRSDPGFIEPVSELRTNNDPWSVMPIDLGNLDIICWAFSSGSTVPATWFSLLHITVIPQLMSPVIAETNDKPKSSDRCNGDCIEPTFYKSKGKVIVKDAFTYNDYSIDVTENHVETPEIIANTNQTNFIILKVYDNGGVNNIKWVDVGFGMPGINYHIDNAEASIEVLLFNTEIEKLVIKDKYNLMDFGNVTSKIVDCGYQQRECLEVTIPHSFRDKFEHNIILIGSTDYRNNDISNYLNDGITINGESINDAPTDKIWRQKYLGNPESEWIEITRTDRINDIWISEDGLEFRHTGGGGFERVNPIDFEK